MNRKSLRTNSRRVVLCALLAALMSVFQVVMSFLPNIEPVSLLVLVYALVFGWDVFYIVVTFILLEGVVFGFHLWWISYLYIWSILAFIVLALPQDNPPIIWAVTAGAFGLLFGALCAIPYLISGGPGAAFAYWAAGIPYDVLHCAGNFTLTWILFKPLYHILKKLHDSQQE